MEMKNCYRGYHNQRDNRAAYRTDAPGGWLGRKYQGPRRSILCGFERYVWCAAGVIRKTELLKGLTRETCVSIAGPVEKRDEETYNPKIPTGTIELEAREITVLGKVYGQLPFEVMTSKEIREDVRLKYRYLDLRNAKVRDNILFRSKVIAFLRRKMTDMGFVEIQTPILCASSPEGARDYIVPSRKYKGKFYALPQAPQQYKQLLMVSGIDKYFQIAPCFRDEDARADRSPGEFYQLDFEMSFATRRMFSGLERKCFLKPLRNLHRKGQR